MDLCVQNDKTVLWLCLYGLLYHERGIRGWCQGRAARTVDLYDTEMGAMKAEGQARPELPRNPGLARRKWRPVSSHPRGNIRRVTVLSPPEGKTCKHEGM